jgi:hypothetical protein
MLKGVYENTDTFSCRDLYLHSTSAPSGGAIWNACHEIAQLLIEKNISYGDSALSPNRIFAQSDNVEQLKVRIDDKLNRVKNNQGYAGDNDVDDLIGYLILLKIAIDKNKHEEV